jgi:hypothetical protein
MVLKYIPRVFKNSSGELLPTMQNIISRWGRGYRYQEERLATPKRL